MTEAMCVAANGIFALRAHLQGAETSRLLPEGPMEYDGIWDYKVRQLAFKANKDGTFNVQAALTTEYAPPPPDDLSIYRHTVSMGTVSASDKALIISAFDALSKAPVITPSADLIRSQMADNPEKEDYWRFGKNMKFVTPETKLVALKAALKLSPSGQA